MGVTVAKCLSLLLLLPVALGATLAQSDPDASRLRDSAYVSTQIKTIDDTTLFRALDLGRHDLGAVRTAAAQGAFEDAYRAWAAYWEKKPKPRYLQREDWLRIDTEILADYDEHRRYFKTRPEERDLVLERAEGILQNEIVVWGEQKVQFGETVDFDSTIGRSGKYGFHYWIWSRPLLMAYVLTHERRYLEQFDRLFNLWYQQRNSIRSPMQEFDVVYYELGLGVRNRMFIDFYLLPWVQRPDQTDRRILKTMLGSARWLYELQRWEGYRPGNWQIHGSFMLVQIALTFPEFRESSEWLRMGLQRMQEHRVRDFFSDGGHYERCPRNYTLATYVAFRNLRYLLTLHDTAREEAWQIHAMLGRTVEWWLAMMTPTAEIPAINDSHRGLFPEAILQDAATLLDKPEGLAVWEALRRGTSDIERQLPGFTGRHMPASGFTVMRSAWKRDALYLNLNYGPYGGGHTHNDLLSVELYAYGKALVVDAGIGRTYDDPRYPEWYKSTRAHNTVVVNEENMVREDVQGEDVVRDSLRETEYLAVSHRGYARFGVTHRRHVVFVRPFYWFMVDDLTGGAPDQIISWYLHSPEVLLRTDTAYVTLGERGLLIQPAGGMLSAREGVGWAASTLVPDPGETELMNWIAFDQIAAAGSPTRFAVLLYPYAAGVPSVAARTIAPGYFTVTRGDTVDHLVIGGDGTVTEGLATDAQFAFLRTVNGLVRSAEASGGSVVRYRGTVVWEPPQAPDQPDPAVPPPESNNR